jgi:2-keto-4-pentenoate hydratase/2-oxohepta-3-ene-1,7-dioic acid hydratase in catechol pathway
MEGHVSRLIRFAVDAKPAWGLVEEGEVFHLPDGPFGDGPARGARTGALDELDLLAPVAPSKVICVARNYVAHAAEHKAEVPVQPLLFFKPPSSVIGPGGLIELPAESGQVEHEGELAIVIGRRCRRIAEGEAWSAVLGISCGNDVTARDIQRSEKLWTRGKGFDTFCPVGPWIVAGLTCEDAADLEVRCSVNGEVRQLGRTREMIFSPSTLISYISQVMTLEPGDLILTGTPAGVSPLEPGDRVTVEIEGVGALTNPVVGEPDHSS